MMDTTTLWGAITGSGIALATAIQVLWARVSADLDDCKKDRVQLFSRVDNLQNQFNEVSTQFAELRGEIKNRPQNS